MNRKYFFNQFLIVLVIFIILTVFKPLLVLASSNRELDSGLVIEDDRLISTDNYKITVKKDGFIDIESDTGDIELNGKILDDVNDIELDNGQKFRIIENNKVIDWFQVEELKNEEGLGTNAYAIGKIDGYEGEDTELVVYSEYEKIIDKNKIKNKPFMIKILGTKDEEIIGYHILLTDENGHYRFMAKDIIFEIENDQYMRNIDREIYKLSDDYEEIEQTVNDSVGSVSQDGNNIAGSRIYNSDLCILNGEGDLNFKESSLEIRGNKIKEIENIVIRNDVSAFPSPWITGSKITPDPLIEVDDRYYMYNSDEKTVEFTYPHPDEYMFNTSVIIREYIEKDQIVDIELKVRDDRGILVCTIHDKGVIGEKYYIDNHFIKDKGMMFFEDAVIEKLTEDSKYSIDVEIDYFDSNDSGINRKIVDCIVEDDYDFDYLKNNYGKDSIKESVIDPIEKIEEKDKDKLELVKEFSNLNMSNSTFSPKGQDKIERLKKIRLSRDEDMHFLVNTGGVDKARSIDDLDMVWKRGLLEVKGLEKPERPVEPETPKDSGDGDIILPIIDEEDVEEVEKIIKFNKNIAYIEGYSDNTVKPSKNVTREEVTTMLYRLLDKDYLDKYPNKSHIFKDVELGCWSEDGIAILSEMKLIRGYPDGNFRPSDTISRAELASIISRVYAVDDGIEYTSDFVDIEDHWARNSINFLVQIGCLEGYSDNTFRPNQNISRAETVTVINKMLGLEYDEDLHDDKVDIYKDLDKDKWYYEAMCAAITGDKYKEE